MYNKVLKTYKFSSQLVFTRKFRNCLGSSIMLKNAPNFQQCVVLEFYWRVLDHHHKYVQIKFKITQYFGSFVYTIYHLVLPPFAKITTCIWFGMFKINLCSCSKNTLSILLELFVSISYLFLGLLWYRNKSLTRYESMNVIVHTIYDLNRLYMDLNANMWSFIGQ